jgi:hypothetical protein
MGKKIYLFIFIALYYSIWNIFANYQPKIWDNMMIQLQWNINTSNNVEVYSIDLFDTSAEFIQELQSQEKWVICYLSIWTFENWREDSILFPDAVLWNDLWDWLGEKRLDISNYQDFQHIILERLNLAQEKWCDGIDPDNVDGFQNDTGFELTAEDQKEYLQFVSQEAKKRNLLIGLKNNLTQISELEPYFDFAINESCFDWNECEYLSTFIENDKPVFWLQYNKTLNDFCPKAQEMKMSFALANYQLDGTKMEFCNNLWDYYQNIDEKEDVQIAIWETKNIDEQDINITDEDSQEVWEEEEIEYIHPLKENNPELAQKVDIIFEKIESKYSQEEKNILYNKLKQKLLLAKMTGQYSRNQNARWLVSYILENIPK